MGFDCNLFCEQTASAIGQMVQSAGAVSHAIGELTKALNGYSHAEGYSSSLPCRQSTVKRMANVICISIVRKPVIKIGETKTVSLSADNAKINWDVLERHFGLDH